MNGRSSGQRAQALRNLARIKDNMVDARKKGRLILPPRR